MLVYQRVYSYSVGGQLSLFLGANQSPDHPSDVIFLGIIHPLEKYGSHVLSPCDPKSFKLINMHKPLQTHFYESHTQKNHDEIRCETSTCFCVMAMY